LNNMNIVFRADSSLNIGTGHIMRCLVLARHLKSMKNQVSFVCREFPGNLINYIESFGINVYRLPDQEEYTSSDWLRVPWEQDVNETISKLSMVEIDWFVIDHYGIDKSWEKEIRKVAKKLMVIDDLANREHDCEILLDQNYHHNFEIRYNHLVDDTCIKCLGPKFALLRDEFIEARKTLAKKEGRIRNLLVFFGGIDLINETEKALNSIMLIDHNKLEVNVIVGQSNPWKSRIMELCHENGFKYHCQINNMSEMIAKSDLAIGAGGSTTWERYCLGLPAITIAVAENQVETAKYCGNLGLDQYLGKSDEVNVESIAQALKNTLMRPDKVFIAREKSLEIVDGNGAERIAALFN
jgi:UDP-2,4-diacetamido-2,4,6-trideoxy-beta-L-altropyranose hydrolase